jgi:Rieske 2Fe-2S family protein
MATAQQVIYRGLKQPEAMLPAHYYFDPDHHRRELDAIWYRDWVYVCPSVSMPDPRCYRVYEIGDQSVLIVRDEDGSLRAFHNTCRHRGSQLCMGEEGRFKFKRIVCPYHNWAYKLDGSLAATTSLATPEGFDPASLGLFPVHVDTWRGLVFVSLSDDPPPLSAAMQRDPGRFDAWPIEDLVLGHRSVKTLACNWKGFWDNFNECLHCPNVHPSLVKLVPIYGRRISGRTEDPDYASHTDDADPKYQGGLRTGAESWSSDGQASPVPIPGLSEEHKALGQTYVVSWPSMFMVGHADYMRIVRMRPLGPEETEITAEWLFPEGAMDHPDFDLENITGFAKQVIAEDGAASELNQRGMHARPFTGGVLMPEEASLRDFRDWVLGRLGET